MALFTMASRVMVFMTDSPSRTTGFLTTCRKADVVGGQRRRAVLSERYVATPNYPKLHIFPAHHSMPCVRTRWNGFSLHDCASWPDWKQNTRDLPC